MENDLIDKLKKKMNVSRLYIHPKLFFSLALRGMPVLIFTDISVILSTMDYP